jgi:hypothetical protein
MSLNPWKITCCSLAIVCSAVGCTLPWTAGGTNFAATMVVETVSVLQTALAGTQTAQAIPIPPSPMFVLPSATATLFITAVPVNPIVETTALCWTGPGSAYPVVSGIKAGTAITVLGVGSKVGWLVIQNPTYHDRCWIEIKNLKLDPYFSTAGLEVFNPPPTPGPKVTPVPTPTS